MICKGCGSVVEYTKCEYCGTIAHTDLSTIRHMTAEEYNFYKKSFTDKFHEPVFVDSPVIDSSIGWKLKYMSNILKRRGWL